MLLSLPVILYILLSLILVRLSYRYARLRSFPGPPIAALTDLWRASAMNYGDWSGILRQVHKKYGTLVRLGPNIISVSDPTAIPIIYSMHGELKKADSYHTMRVNSPGGLVIGSVIDIQDERESATLKRAVGSAFATKNLLDYEEILDFTINMLVESMRTKRTVDLFDILQQFQADFLMRVAFGKEIYYVREDDSTAHISGYPRLAHWGRWQSLHSLENLIYKPPLLRKYMRHSDPPKWASMAKEELQMRRKDLGTAKANTRKDLITKFVEGGEKSGMDPVILIKAVSSASSAGFDTTAYTLTTIFFRLLKHPETMTKLRAEINDAYQAGTLSSAVKYDETHTLKYLHAVVKESMRLHPFLPPLLEREVPQPGLEICGRWIPGGTVVACPAPVIHHDTSLFGEDADTFRPDRWLQTTEANRLKMEHAFLSFGAGKRTCWGRHIGEMEMRKVVPRLLLEFDRIDLEDPNHVFRPKVPYCSEPVAFSVQFTAKQAE